MQVLSLESIIIITVLGIDGSFSLSLSLSSVRNKINLNCAMWMSFNWNWKKKQQSGMLIRSSTKFEQNNETWLLQLLYPNKIVHFIWEKKTQCNQTLKFFVKSTNLTKEQKYLIRKHWWVWLSCSRRILIATEYCAIAKKCMISFKTM